VAIPNSEHKMAIQAIQSHSRSLFWSQWKGDKGLNNTI